MSGITTFELAEDSSYTLVRTSRKGGAPLAFSGQIDLAQRQVLFDAMSRHSILQIPASTRPIGDDEQPISIALDGAGEHVALTLWAGDARDNAQLAPVTAALYSLIDQLSGGKIQLRP